MANTYTLIASSTVGSGGVADITFSAIPATYTDLLIKLSLRSNQSQIYGSCRISFNNSTSNFTYKVVYGEGANAASFGGSTNFMLDQNGDTSTASTFSNTEIYIPNYASSNYKSFSADAVTENNATTAYAELGAFLWSDTAAITSVKISTTSTNLWKEYSTAYLYGIKSS